MKGKFNSQILIKNISFLEPDAICYVNPTLLVRGRVVLNLLFQNSRCFYTRNFIHGLTNRKLSFGPFIVVTITIQLYLHIKTNMFYCSI